MVRVLRTRQQELEAKIKQCYAELEDINQGRPVPEVGWDGVGECNNQASTPMGLRQESPEETIDYLFTFHDDPDKTPHYVEIRESAKQFAKVLIRHCPPCADRTTAIRKVREAVMTANAAVALSGRGL